MIFVFSSLFQQKVEQSFSKPLISKVKILGFFFSYIYWQKQRKCIHHLDAEFSWKCLPPHFTSTHNVKTKTQTIKNMACSWVSLRPVVWCIADYWIEIKSQNLAPNVDNSFDKRGKSSLKAVVANHGNDYWDISHVFRQWFKQISSN